MPDARICEHFSLYQQIRETDDTVVVFEPLLGTPLYTVIVGLNHTDLRETAKLAAQVEQSDLPDRDRIAALLRAGGTGAALRGVKADESEGA